MIVLVDEKNIIEAAKIHSISWIDSHKSFCTPEFINMHSPQNQQEYIEDKINSGSKFYMLVEDKPIGVVSITNSLIEDLYILPDKQNKGYGTKLLKFAIEKCIGIPTLWILENNIGAKRLYLRMGFTETGRINAITDTLNEIELSLHK